jgi:protein tyrosine/serine phosphatase
MAPNQASSPSHSKSKRKRYLFFVLAILLVAGSVWLWEEVLEDRIIPKRFGVVEQGQIYRSGQLHKALVEKTLRKYKIAKIVDLTGAVPGDQNQQAEIRATQDLGIERVELHLKGDGTGDIRHYVEAIAFIHDAVHQNKPVLVHCAAGAQRTGGVIAAYRMLVQKKPPSEVQHEMTNYGWRATNNPALPQYLNNNMGRLAEMLVAKGVLDEVPEPLPQLGP